jgi:hypothetical protein
MIMIGLLLLAALVAAAAAGLAAEDRPHMKRIDVSPAAPDRGQWLDHVDGARPVHEVVGY